MKIFKKNISGFTVQLCRFKFGYESILYDAVTHNAIWIGFIVVGYKT